MSLEAQEERLKAYCNMAGLEMAEVIAQIFAWRRAGWSLRKIAAELNRRGVSTKQGGEWYAATVRYLLQNSLHREVA